MSSVPRSPAIEQHGIEAIGPEERHGRVRSLFSLWWSANLGFPAFAIGILGTTVFGLAPVPALVAVAAGNVIGALLLGLASALGPESGLPGMPLSQRGFGRTNALPAALNWLSCLGWFTVNTILGAQALQILLNVPLWLALVAITLAQVALAAFGHDLIHRLERYAAYLLAAIFALMSIRLFGRVPAHFWHQGGANLGGFLLLLAASASYLFSWAPYGADYSRYLPVEVGRARAFWATFWGAFASTSWVEVLGILVGSIAPNLTTMGLVQRAMGPLAAVGLLGAVVGTLTANVVNIYTAATAVLTMGLKFHRLRATLLAGALGLILALLGARGFSANYEDFLLLISYWIAPWMAVLVVDYYLKPKDASGGIGGFWAFLIGVLCTVPFISQSLFEGPVARLLGGGDVGYYVGFLTALFSYLLIRARTTRSQGLAGPRVLPPNVRA